jgi:hypothetical protein
LFNKRGRGLVVPTAAANTTTTAPSTATAAAAGGAAPKPKPAAAAAAAAKTTKDPAQPRLALASAPKNNNNKPAPAAAAAAAATTTTTVTPAAPLPKARNAYALFSGDAARRKEATDALKASGVDEPTMPQVSKQMAAIWSALAAEEGGQDPYKAVAAAEKAAREAALAALPSDAAREAALEAGRGGKKKRAAAAVKAEKGAAAAAAAPAPAPLEAAALEATALRLYASFSKAELLQDNPDVDESDADALQALAQAGWEALGAEGQQKFRGMVADAGVQPSAAAAGGGGKGKGKARGGGGKGKARKGSDDGDDDEDDDDEDADDKKRRKKAKKGSRSRPNATVKPEPGTTAAAAELDDDDSDLSDREEGIDWTEHPAQAAFAHSIDGAGTADGARLLVARRGVDLTAYGVARSAALLRLQHNGGGTGAGLLGSSSSSSTLLAGRDGRALPALADDYSRWVARFRAAAAAAMGPGGAIDLEALPEGSPLEACFLLGKLREAGGMLSAQAVARGGMMAAVGGAAAGGAAEAGGNGCGVPDALIKVPALGLSMVVQRLLDLERAKTRAALARVAELEAEAGGRAAMAEDGGAGSP